MRVKSERKGYGMYEVYICSGRSDMGLGCPQGVVHRAAADGAVLAYFERVGLDVEATRRELGERAARERDEIRALRSNADRELGRVEAGIEKIERDYTLGDLPAPEYARLRASLEDQARASRDAVERLRAREAEVTEGEGLVEDVELLARLTDLRAAIAGDVRANPDDFAATHAALRRLFEGFILRATPGLVEMDAVVEVDGEEVKLHGVPVAGSGRSAFYLEPVPRSDAVVLGKDGIVPVPLGLRSESPANREGGFNAPSR
jgi:hypothetical protein